jgi:hypothetical protein
LPKEEYDNIGPPFLSLQFSPMSLQLPNLQGLVVYYGTNGRPDADTTHPLLHFSITGTHDIASTSPDSPLYLVYDKNKTPIKYAFSPDNEETSLWIEASPAQGNYAQVEVAMKNEAGEIIRKPENFARFKLKERTYVRIGMEKWEIGKLRVDGTLLARQKARWYGKDLFLEKYGGEEYQQFEEKQRIDFGEKEEAYSVYIGAGTALAWIDDRWLEVIPGPETRRYPLRVLNKVEERIIKFDLWDVGGKLKVTLNLIKSQEPIKLLNLEQTFKFVGARTRSQFIFEVNNERILVSPKDWFLYSDETWKKLTTPKEIDDFVERKTIGQLFVVDDIVRKEGKQVLLGTLFNASRTNMKSIEIPLQTAGSPSQTKEGQPETKKPTHFENEVKDMKGTYKGLTMPLIPQNKQFKQQDTKTND